MSSAPAHGPDTHDDHAFTGEPVQVLSPDEPRTPGWIPLLGIAFFTDAGRLWSGDVPYGVNTPTRYSVGFSLLGTAPAASARLWRVDLAYAMNPEIGRRRFELRIGNTDKTTFFLPEPADLQSGRERTVPTSVFRWPQ